jgi:hypothetical protein
MPWNVCSFYLLASDHLICGDGQAFSILIFDLCTILVGYIYVCTTPKKNDSKELKWKESSCFWVDEPKMRERCAVVVPASGPAVPRHHASTLVYTCLSALLR